MCNYTIADNIQVKVCEKEVTRIWQEGRFSRLYDEGGNNVEVVFGGRRAVNRGCDFQDAVLKINGVKCCGDVEVHVSSDLWKKHGHNHNKKYDNVILHVALWDKGGLPAQLHSGISIPTVILGSALSQFTLNRQGCPHAERLSCIELEDILAGCGLQRLSLKAGEFIAQISSQEPHQVLYAGICQALGYARNKMPMSKLAELMPFSRWKEVRGEGVEHKMAIAMGIAGLLPSQSRFMATWPSDRIIEKLELEWKFYQHTGERMQRPEWCFSGVRPANSPLRRVAALCFLMDKIEDSWLQNSRGLIERMNNREAASVLEAKLMLAGQDYWACHYDFGRPLRRPHMLLGRGRAREITINVILPFYLAMAWLKSDGTLADRVIELYSMYPASPENEILRFMQKLLLPGGWQQINSCVQQGLLHLFHNYCRERDCSRCPVFTRQRSGRGRRRAAHCLSVRQ